MGYSFIFFVDLPKNWSVKSMIDIMKQVIVVLVPELELFIVGCETLLLDIHIGLV